MARIKIEGTGFLDATLRRMRGRTQDAFRKAREDAYARLRAELAGGRAARQGYDLDLTATEIIEEPKALPVPTGSKDD